MTLQIIRNDITKMKTDAIVNAANSRLQEGGGVCGAIFAAAGPKKLQEECDEIGYCAKGEAVITKGYRLPAKYVVHTVGPVWNGGDNGEEEALRSCYKTSLKLAELKGLSSISFPLISSGIYGYPKDEALKIALEEISSYLMNHEMDIYLVAFDKKAFQLSKSLTADIQEYIDENYVELAEEKNRYRTIDNNNIKMMNVQCDVCAPESSIEEAVSNMEETFSEKLLALIDERGLKDSTVYKRANIDRRLFSKIRSNKAYKPSKPTVLAFAIALELNRDETLELLETAGFTLSHSNKADIICEYFINNENYDIFQINEALFSFDENMLGA